MHCRSRRRLRFSDRDCVESVTNKENDDGTWREQSKAKSKSDWYRSDARAANSNVHVLLVNVGSNR